MKLGAQLYSVRSYMQNPEDLRRTFHRIREIGYENVQLSGAAPTPAEILRDVSEETGLEIVCTHSPLDRILNDTDALIREHKTFGCSVIGLGAMPKELRGSLEGMEEFLRQLDEPVRKIREAGLAFAYHNHAFEFAKPDPDASVTLYDLMLERLPDWNFIMDTYWVEFAGYSATDYISKIGSKRLPNIHFKDLAKNEERSICACGDGVLDFGRIYEVCRANGIQNVLVEQDNADRDGKAFDEMERSFRHLRPIIG